MTDDKRKPGRPPIPGRMVVVKLDEDHIARARELGAGKITKGIRRALKNKGRSAP